MSMTTMAFRPNFFFFYSRLHYKRTYYVAFKVKNNFRDQQQPKGKVKDENDAKKKNKKISFPIGPLFCLIIIYIVLRHHFYVRVRVHVRFVVIAVFLTMIINYLCGKTRKKINKSNNEFIFIFSFFFLFSNKKR